MFLKRDVILAQEYLAFLLLNIFDLYLTGYIFKHNGKEANAIAVWVTDLGSKISPHDVAQAAVYGLMFFATYKFLLVTIVVLACEGIATKSIMKSRVIITAGCLIYLFLVIYESCLIYTHITGVKHPSQAPSSQVRLLKSPNVLEPEAVYAGAVATV